MGEWAERSELKANLGYVERPCFYIILVLCCKGWCPPLQTLRQAGAGECCHVVASSPVFSRGVWKTAWYIHCHKQVCFLFKPFPSWGQLNLACLLGSWQFKGSSYTRIVQSNLRPKSISSCLRISVTVWSSSPQRSEEVFKSEDAQTLSLYVQNHPDCLRILQGPWLWRLKEAEAPRYDVVLPASLCLLLPGWPSVHLSICLRASSPPTASSQLSVYAVSQDVLSLLPRISGQRGTTDWPPLFPASQASRERSRKQT